MTFKTLAALTTDVQTALYQVAGPNVQIYSEAIVQQLIQEAFDHCFTKRFWHHFRARQQRTLDGVTGKVTVVPTILQYDDVQYVFRQGQRRPLPVLPSMYNTLGMDGTTPRFVEASGDTSLIVVYPLTSTGDILITGRIRPPAYTSGQTVAFDALCLKHYAAFSYFAADGANPAEAARQQAMFETRLKQLELDDQNFAIPLDSRSTEVPEQWYETGPWL